MSVDIEWSEPPRAGGLGRGKTQLFIDELKRRPGEWAKYPYPIKRVSQTSTYKAAHPGTQWSARTIDGVVTMWGRWIGEGGA